MLKYLVKAYELIIPLFTRFVLFKYRLSIKDILLQIVDLNISARSPNPIAEQFLLFRNL